MNMYDHVTERIHGRPQPCSTACSACSVAAIQTMTERWIAAAALIGFGALYLIYPEGVSG